MLDNIIGYAWNLLSPSGVTTILSCYILVFVSQKKKKKSLKASKTAVTENVRT